MSYVITHTGLEIFSTINTLSKSGQLFEVLSQFQPMASKLQLHSIHIGRYHVHRGVYVEGNSGHVLCNFTRTPHAQSANIWIEHLRLELMTKATLINSSDVEFKNVDKLYSSAELQFTTRLQSYNLAANLMLNAMDPSSMCLLGSESNISTYSKMSPIHITDSYAYLPEQWAIKLDKLYTNKKEVYDHLVYIENHLRFDKLNTDARARRSLILNLLLWDDVMFSQLQHVGSYYRKENGGVSYPYLKCSK